MKPAISNRIGAYVYQIRRKVIEPTDSGSSVECQIGEWTVSVAVTNDTSVKTASSVTECLSASA